MHLYGLDFVLNWARNSLEFGNFNHIGDCHMDCPPPQPQCLELSGEACASQWRQAGIKPGFLVPRGCPLPISAVLAE